MINRLPTIRRLLGNISSPNTRRIVSYYREHGLTPTAKKVIQTLVRILKNSDQFTISQKAYQKWIEESEPDTEQLKIQRNHKFKSNPKISLIVPTYNTPLSFLKEMVKSVLEQTYSNWELCIADGSNEKTTIEYLESLIQEGGQIKITFLERNYGIAGNTNRAMDLADGDFICLLDHDDTLAPFALYEIVKTINEKPDVDIIYSDEDKLTFDGRLRVSPHFKPDWSPYNLLSYNYITHLLTVKRSLLEKVGYIREGYEGAQDFDLTLRITEKARHIYHIPKILYHWREHNNSTAKNPESKSYTTFSTQRAVADALRRRNIAGRVFGGPFLSSARVVFTIKGEPLVTIVIPTIDHVDTLKTCISSITNRSTYRNFEIIIIDTGSKEKATQEYYDSLASNKNIRLLQWSKPFNYSAVNNYAAKQAKGEYIIFLNNDVEVQTAEWIESMLEFCQNEDVGAVGAKLYYPDYTIQHGGVIIGVGGVAGHSHKSFPRHSNGYYGRLSVPTNLSAVTAACVMIPTKVFKQVRGFDEGYPLSFNDIDLCLKIREKGYSVIWTPHAQLVHYESKTRGYEDNPEKQARFKMEIDRFKSRWGDFLEMGDPYYNPNLTLVREDFSIRKTLDEKNT